MAYSKTGPFTNVGAPGISASFLNNIENFLVTVNSAATDSHFTSSGNGIFNALGLAVSPTAVSVSGTSGTASLYQFWSGTVKGALVYWSNFANTSAQNLTLPTAFASIGYFLVGETQNGTVTFTSSGTGVVCSVQNTIASAGGTQSPMTNLKGGSQGHTRGGFNVVQLLLNGGVNATGMVVVIGI